MRKFLIAISLATLMTSCSSYSNSDKQTAKFHDDGRAKAVITLTPVYDYQNIHIPWSLSEDLTDIIKNKLMGKSNIYISNFDSLTPSEEGEVKTPERYEENSFLNLSLENLKVKYPSSEFVVFMELADHTIAPKQSTEGFLDKLTPSYALTLCMRVRIYDLRGEVPKAILQEMVQQTHLIPKQFAKLDYDSAIWGKKTYSISPIGFAHMQFAREVAQRIDSYLVLAKTH